MTENRSSTTGKLGGVLLLLTAGTWILLSLPGLIFAWRVRAPVTARVEEDIALIHNALIATDEGLDVVEDSLESARESFSNLESSLDAAALSVQESAPMVKSLQTLVGEDLPEALEATDTSLASAQASAEIIDSFLRALTSVPLLGAQYDPPVPLHVALENVAASLEDLPASLLTMESSLEDTHENLIQIQIDMSDLVDGLEPIDQSLAEAQAVVIQYQDVMDGLIERTTYLQENAPRWLLIGTWTISGLIVWGVFLQLGLFMVGIHLLKDG